MPNHSKGDFSLTELEICVSRFEFTRARRCQQHHFSANDLNNLPIRCDALSKLFRKTRKTSKNVSTIPVKSVCASQTTTTTTQRTKWVFFTCKTHQMRNIIRGQRKWAVGAAECVLVRKRYETIIIIGNRQKQEYTVTLLLPFPRTLYTRAHRQYNLGENAAHNILNRVSVCVCLHVV